MIFPDLRLYCPAINSIRTVLTSAHSGIHPNPKGFVAKFKPYRRPIYWAARAFAAFLSLLPRPSLLFLARVSGRVAYLLVRHHRKTAIENLTRAFSAEKSEQEIRRIAKEVFIHASETALEMLQFPKLNSEKAEKFVEIGKGYETYAKLLSEGKGLIALTSHIGNWELLGGLFTMKGFQGMAIARRLRYEPFNRWIESLRRAVKMEIFYRDDSPKEIIKWLKQGKLIGILPDQDIASVDGVFVNFFGRPAYTPTAPVRLSLATGAPILTIFLIREKHNRYRIVLGDVIRPVVTTNKEEALLEFTQQWTTSCEKVIRQYPEQWGWFHNRWKTQESASQVMAAQ